MSAPLRVLVVCLGNICRSPMAEGILRRHFEDAGLGHRVTFDSAGTGAWHVGQAPDPRATRICRENGIAIDGLRARQVASRDFEDFDLVLCADASNLRHLRAMAPRDTWPKIALLLDHAGLGPDAEVPDPYDGSIEHFRRVHRLLEDAARSLLTKLQLPA